MILLGYENNFKKASRQIMDDLALATIMEK